MSIVKEDTVRVLEDENTRLTSELRRKEEEVADLRARLVEQAKLASLGTIAAGIAHEIRNPLGFIRSFSELAVTCSAELAQDIQEGAQKPCSDLLGDVSPLLHDLKLNCEKIHEHTRRIEEVVRSILDHTRGYGGQQEMIDVNALVETYLDLAYHGMRAQSPSFDVGIERQYNPHAGAVNVHREKMGRVLINILNNAFESVTERRTHREESYRPRVKVATNVRGGMIEIRIEDNGIGVPVAVRDRIFEPFITTKPAGHGTGLGLPLSRQIVVEDHGGRIDVESVDGEGAAFSIWLPITPSPAQAE